MRTACSGESFSPLKSTRGALPVINSPLQPLFSLFSNHPSAAHCSRLSHTFSCTGRKNYIISHFYIYFSFEKDIQTNNLKKSFIRMMISLIVVVITFLSVQHLHRRHLFHLHNSVAQYIRKKVVKRTMGDTTLLRQWQLGDPQDTLSAPLSHLAATILDAFCSCQPHNAGALKPLLFDASGAWWVWGSWASGLWGWRAGAWAVIVPVSGVVRVWGFFSFRFESSACQGAKPICLSSKTPRLQRSAPTPLAVALPILLSTPSCSHLFPLCLVLGHVDSYQ